MTDRCTLRRLPLLALFVPAGQLPLAQAQDGGALIDPDELNIEEDEFVEVTPDIVRLRKIHLTENARKRSARGG